VNGDFASHSDASSDTQHNAHGPGSILLSVRHMLKCIADNPRTAPQVVRWCLFSRYRMDPLKVGYPWVTISALLWLDSFITRDSRVFEWGTGGSTLYWGERVRAVTSVEHDRSWFEKTACAIASSQLTNCDLRLREPEGAGNSCRLHSSAHDATYESAFPSYESSSFKHYVTEIDVFPDSFFDLISVDGRARPSCLIHAVRKVKPGGALMLDNSERSRYQASFELFRSWRRHDFAGPGVGPTFGVWCTTIWERPVLQQHSPNNDAAET
jgi:hypothetical protein